MKRTVLARWFLLGAVGLVSIFISCNSLMAAGGEPINVGYTTDFSGSQTAMYGVVEAPVIKWVVEKVNAAGGVNGRQINLIVLDNKGDIATMLGHLKMFKERDSCPVILQGVSSALGLAAKKWADENHIPIVSPDCGSDALLQKEGKAWWFRTALPIYGMVSSAVDRVAHLGYKEVAVGATTVALGDQALGIIQEGASKLGVKVMTVARCEPKSKDLTVQAKRLKDSGTKAVILADYDKEVGVWGRAIKGLGWNPYVNLALVGMLIDALKMYPPELFEGWETPMIVDENKPIVREIWDKVAAYTGTRVENELGPRAYDAIIVTLEAIKLSGNPDSPEAIRDGFYKIKDLPIATGFKKTGDFEIGRNHLVGEKDPPVFYRVKSGKIVKAD